MRISFYVLKTGISLCSGFLIFASGVLANDGYGAYLERVSFSDEVKFTWYVPPRAELIVVDEKEAVIAAIQDSGLGKLITALPAPDVNAGNMQVFYSDGVGVSSRVTVSISQNNSTFLLAPTIYSIPNINGQYGSLGFVGRSHPGSIVHLKIELSTNEKIDYKTLANSTGEWQIIPSKLPPGKHTALVFAEFQQLQSPISQDVSILVLAPTDQFIQDLGSGTRKSIERIMEQMPGPMQDAARQIDSKSEIISKYVFPTILTLTTLAQSGILVQNLVYLLFQGLMALGQLLGIVKPRQPMGVVYDSVSKRPLGRVIVRLYEASSQRLIETDVTSASGVFSFMPNEGFYYLRVSKPGYIYPSHLISSRRDGRYTPVYSGEDIAIQGGSAVVNVAVPLDPEAYQESYWMKLNHIWQKWYEPINQWLLWFGFFLAVLSYTRVPSKMNFLILWFYMGGLVYFWYQGRRFKREYGLVVNKLGKPLSGVELVLTDIEFNRLVSRRVTDEKGRYQFMAPPGKYQIRVVTPALEVMKAKGGYKGEELTIAGERGQTKHVIPKIIVKERKITD